MSNPVYEYQETQKRMALEALDRVRNLIEQGADTIDSALSFENEETGVYFKFEMNWRAAS